MNKFITSLALASVLAMSACKKDNDDVVEADADTDADTDTDTDMQPRGELNPPTPDATMQIDRSGRPAISTATIATFEADSAVKDAAKEAYNTTANDAAAFETDIAESLAILDAIDTVCGNQLGASGADYSFLAGVLNDDRLYLAADRGTATCTQYLGLEAEVLGLVTAPDGGCGGRGPDYDVIETSYSVLVNGSFADFDDGIAANDVPNSATVFPYLADPAAVANYTVTAAGTGYSVHDGSAFAGVIHDGTASLGFASGIQSGDDLNLVFPDIPPGTYSVYWYMDLSGDGACDAPPVDHVWEETVTVSNADATVTRNHDTTWVDNCALIVP